MAPPPLCLHSAGSGILLFFLPTHCRNINTTSPTKVCGKVLSEKNDYKSFKRALLSSNVIGADHQNSCLFTNKGHFSSPLWVLICVLAKCYE